MLTNHQEYEERDDDLTYRKIRRMKARSKKIKRLKETGMPMEEKHKKFIEKGLKMLINSESVTNLGTKQFS